MSNDPAATVADAQATPDIRMLTTIAWIAGPTIIFVGWFLMSIIAGSQRPGAADYETSFGLVFLFALITSVPLIIVSLIGGATTMFSESLKTQRVMNLMALIWNAIVFAIYFGLLGIIGSLPEDGFPITPLTISALIPIALVTVILPVALYLFNRRVIARAPAAVPAPLPANTYDI